jgi:lysozyme family protein
MTNPNFDKAAAFTLLCEGPMSNDATDPGGLTKYGIAKSAHPDINIATLTKEQALDIYYVDYWLNCCCDLLPFAFAIAVFECAVNQGPRTAKVLLQTVIKVTPDGNLGPASKAALSSCHLTPDLLASFLALRVQRYVSIKDSNLAEYEADNKGWFKRLFLCTMAGLQ